MLVRTRLRLPSHRRMHALLAAAAPRGMPPRQPPQPRARTPTARAPTARACAQWQAPVHG